MPFLLRMRKQRNQTGFAAKRLRGLSTKKKPRRIEPRRSTIQLSTWSDGHQQKAQQQISSNLSNALPISELWLYWHGSIRAGPSIQGIGFPQYWFCTGHITSPVRLQFPLCQLQHTKQLHSIHVSRAWLLDSHQNNYLICQLVQTQGQKKSLDKIKASLKQMIHVPTDFNSMGTQFQLFAAACGVFFWWWKCLFHKSEAAPHHNQSQQKDIQKSHHIRQSLPLTGESNVGLACVSVRQSQDPRF